MNSPVVAEESCIYLVRHAESFGNIVRKLLPPSEALMTDKGRLQAKVLGEFLREETFTMAISSDYPRAMETAQIILAQSTRSNAVTLQTTENLREKNFGVYEDNGDYDAIIEAFDQSGLDFVDWTPEGGETREEIEGRIESFLQDIFAKVDERNEAQTILALTHADFLTHFYKYLACKRDIITVENWHPEYYKVTSNTGYIKIAIERNPNQSKLRKLRILSCHENLHLQSQKSNEGNEHTRSFKGCVQQ